MDAYPDDHVFPSQGAAELALGLVAGTISDWVRDGKVPRRPTETTYLGRAPSPIRMGDIRPFVTNYHRRPPKKTVLEAGCVPVIPSLRDRLRRRRTAESRPAPAGEE